MCIRDRFIAQDNKRIYVWTEVVLTNILWLVCSVFFYYEFQLIGLGISLVVRSIIGDSISFIIVSKCYKFRLSGYNAGLLAAMAVMVTAGFAASYWEKYDYMILIPLIVFSLIFSFVKLKRRL